VLDFPINIDKLPGSNAASWLKNIQAIAGINVLNEMRVNN
jgi:hypothetical protein